MSVLFVAVTEFNPSFEYVGSNKETAAFWTDFSPEHGNAVVSGRYHSGSCYWTKWQKHVVLKDKTGKL